MKLLSIAGTGRESVFLGGSDNARAGEALAARALADANAGRPATSESEDYHTVYNAAVILREVREGRAYLAVSNGLGCRRCGANTDQGTPFLCDCESGMPDVVPGFYVSHGAECHGEPAEFRSCEQLAPLRAAGYAVVDRQGEDIGAHLHRIQ